MNLIMVRHGQTPKNAKNICMGQTCNDGLNTEGFRQADKVAWALRKEDIDALYVSPLRRAQQTAEAILKHFEPLQTAIIEEALTECSFGIFEGAQIQPKGAYEKALAKSGLPFDQFVPENGESYLQAQERVMRFFREIYQRHYNHTVVLVSHGTALSLMLMGILKVKLSRANYDKHKLANGAYSKVIIYPDGGCSLVRFNALER